MYFKFDQNLLFLWIFLIIQIVVLVGYLRFSYSWTKNSLEKAEKLEQPIKFIQKSKKWPKQKKDLDRYKTYYNSDVDSEIYLKTEDVDNYFVTVNDTICFQLGTDIRYMERNMKLHNKGIKCECLPGYHGNDCSLPEVIWRAFIAFRQETVIHKRKGKTRRIIHMFRINHPAEIPLAVIKINELFNNADLFIVAESNRTQYGDTKPFYFKRKLDAGLCKDKQHKILFTPVYEWQESKSVSSTSWERNRKIIKNLQEDDLLMELDSSEIPSLTALLFFKLYDGFSLPLQFRMKWNVYGYFYQHPQKTKQVTTGSTMQMLNDIYKNNPDSIEKDAGLVIGDLNHYGGWFCELCYAAKDILHMIQTRDQFENLLPSRHKVIDIKYVEESIAEGLYVDGKTSLLKNQENRDKYFAPDFVSKQYWKYDSLTINFYSKIDYN